MGGLYRQLHYAWRTRYNIVGVLESRGASFGMSQDNQCLIQFPQLDVNFLIEIEAT